MKPKWTPVRVKLGQIAAWEGNPRMSTKAQAKRIIDSETKFGQPVPFLLNPEENGRYLLLDGHQRLSAWLTVYGADHVMDAMVANRKLTEAEHKELIITLHTGATGEWNWQQLSGWNAGDLQSWGMNADTLKQWNNDANNLKELLKSETVEPVDAEPQIDRAAELQEKWQTATGQLWKLGEHRLLIGDCTVRENVERLMGGERAMMVFTDPPYNVSYQDNESIESLKKRNRRTDGLVVSNDSMSDEEFDNFLFSFLSELPIDAGGAFYLCSPAGNTETQFRNAINRVSGLMLKECIVWVKDQFVFGRQDYHWRHESILYGWKDGAAHYFIDDHTQDTVWEVKRPRISEFHPTMKPIEIPEKGIKNSSIVGAIIYEPFAGSGTTIIAAHNLNRRCYAMEISEKYGAVILERFYTATGITPVLID